LIASDVAAAAAVTAAVIATMAVLLLRVILWKFRSAVKAAFSIAVLKVAVSALNKTFKLPRVPKTLISFNLLFYPTSKHFRKFRVRVRLRCFGFHVQISNPLGYFRA
jgi:hypothetical protein